MVRAFSRQESIQKLKSFQLMKMFDMGSNRNAHSYTSSSDNHGRGGSDERAAVTRSCCSRVGPDPPVRSLNIGSSLRDDSNKGPVSCLDSVKAKSTGSHQDMEMMKERFSKLLLGEDMSGGGKGVSSALALSNAITNLAASVFGEQRKLEPMSPDRRTRWKKEMEWFLSVTDHIVEFVPSQQLSKDGVHMDIMVTRQRNDLHMNIPALRKLDAMLIGYLDQFSTQTEFWYVAKDANEAEKGDFHRNDDKWWLPTVKVSPEGISDVCRKWLNFQKESVNQVLKASMAINAQVLSEIEIPDNYIESLPKNGRYCLGDSIYKSITDDYFDPEQFLGSVDLSSEHKVLDLKNKMEASVIIWQRKMTQKDHGKSSWGTSVSIEKRELFEERAETILILLKQRYPGISQSALDISKIQYNKDIGYAILESYSRVIESLAFTVISRIEDVFYADSLTRNQPLSERFNGKPAPAVPLAIMIPKLSRHDQDTDGDRATNSPDTPSSKTLSEFMGWGEDAEINTNTTTTITNTNTNNRKNSRFKDANDPNNNNKVPGKPANINTTKRFSYLEKLENFSLRSPTARH